MLTGKWDVGLLKENLSKEENLPKVLFLEHKLEKIYTKPKPFNQNSEIKEIKWINGWISNKSK